MSLFSSSRDHAELEQRLRAGAAAFGPRPPRELRGRILAELRAPPALVAPPEPLAARGAERWGSCIAAAAAALVLCGAWWLTRREEARVERAGTVVALGRGLFDAGTRVLSLPGEVEGNLRLEAENLLADTTRVTAGVMRGLPAPLRERLERL
jgi:hypothetical protein